MKKNSKGAIVVKKGKPKVREPSPNSLSYNGPIAVPHAKEQAISNTVVLFDCLDFQTTMAGVMNASYGSQPDFAPKWSSFSALWEEFRVLGWKVHYVPSNRYTRGTVYTAPIVGVVDRKDAAPLSSYAEASGYESARILSLDTPWTVEVKMQNAEEAQFMPTDSPSSHTYIKFYGDVLSSSTKYGKVFISYLVQFRGVYG